MAAELPHDLQANVKAELDRTLVLLKEAGWIIDPIRWDVASGTERRVTFSAKLGAGRQFHLVCPEDRIAERLMRLLAHTRSTDF